MHEKGSPKLELNLSGINAGDLSDAGDANDMDDDHGSTDAAGLALIEPKPAQLIELNEKLETSMGSEIGEVVAE